MSKKANDISNLAPVVLTAAVVLSFTSCKQEDVQEPAEPEVKQMQSICELAATECYYHNVYKYKVETEKKVLLMTQKTKKHFWLEYTGVVTYGIDASQLTLSFDGETVEINLPEAKVLRYKIDLTSLSEDSYVVDKDSEKIGADELSAALASAQETMKTKAEADTEQIQEAQNRVKKLLTAYVDSISEVSGKEYTIKWNMV